MILCCYLLSFHFNSKESLKHFFQSRTNSNELPHCLSGKVLISPSFVKPVLLDTVFLVDVFFFQQFEYINPLPSGLIISAEKSINNIMETLRYITNHFSFSASRIHIYISIRHLGYNVSQCGSLQIHPSWKFLSFLNLCVHFFPQIWKVFLSSFFK